MDREQLIAEAQIAGRAARHNLRFIQQNPDKVDQAKAADNVAYLNMLIQFSKAEMKNARRPGRASRLRSRLMTLLSSILTAEHQ